MKYCLKLRRHELKCVRHHLVTEKHPVDPVIPNLTLFYEKNNAHCESVREILLQTLMT